MLIVANFGAGAYDAYTIGALGPGVWRVRFNSDWRGYDASFTDQPSYDAAAQDAPPTGTRTALR